MGEAGNRETVRISVVGRREVLVGAAAGLSLLVLARASWAADPAKTVPPSLYEQALDKILGESKPRSEKVVLELPEIAENGNTVPYTITVESPMTVEDHIKAIHVLSTANPLPNIIDFHLTPKNGLAAVASRMRLAKTQDVVVLAERSDGKFLIAQRAVKVTIGGCGG